MLLPHNAEAMQNAFAAPGVSEMTAMRNGSLQGAYLIIAARALGWIAYSGREGLTANARAER
jgi:hypothetical protein